MTEVSFVRLNEAPAPTLTDAAGHNEKGRPDSVAASGATRGELPKKPTGASADDTRASLTPTHPGLADTSKVALSLSPRTRSKARHGADNEHHTF